MQNDRMSLKSVVHIHEEYPKHDWMKKEDGSVDLWAASSGFHNGPMCNRCYTTKCIYCDPDYDDEACVVDEYKCPTCDARLSFFEKDPFCSKCGQALEWGGLQNA